MRIAREGRTAGESRSSRQIDERHDLREPVSRRALPDPDLLIRTAGEMRVSNYLLWQISYAEIYVTDVYWPEFRVKDLHDAIREYARRDRRFGALSRPDWSAE